MGFFSIGLAAHHSGFFRDEFPNHSGQFGIHRWGQQFARAIAKQPGMRDSDFLFGRVRVTCRIRRFDPLEPFHHAMNRLMGAMFQVLVTGVVMAGLEFVQNVQDQGEAVQASVDGSYGVIVLGHGLLLRF